MVQDRQTIGAGDVADLAGLVDSGQAVVDTATGSTTIEFEPSNYHRHRVLDPAGFPVFFAHDTEGCSSDTELSYDELVEELGDGSHEEVKGPDPEVWGDDLLRPTLLSVGPPQGAGVKGPDPEVWGSQSDVVES